MADNTPAIRGYVGDIVLTQGYLTVYLRPIEPWPSNIGRLALGQHVKFEVYKIEEKRVEEL